MLQHSWSEHENQFAEAVRRKGADKSMNVLQRSFHRRQAKTNTAQQTRHGVGKTSLESSETGASLEERPVPNWFAAEAATCVHAGQKGDALHTMNRKRMDKWILNRKVDLKELRRWVKQADTVDEFKVAARKFFISPDLLVLWTTCATQTTWHDECANTHHIDTFSEKGIVDPCFSSAVCCTMYYNTRCM